MHRTEFEERKTDAEREVVINYIDHRGACCMREIPLMNLAALILNNVNAPRRRDPEEALQTQTSFRQ